jgi:hypothetical protein
VRPREVVSMFKGSVLDVGWPGSTLVLSPAKTWVSDFNGSPRAILPMTKKHLAS